jgi:hypothetical protein
MTDKKTIKRAVKAVWDEVKALRSERGKSYTAADITAASEELARHSTKLKELAGDLSALSAMPPGEPKTPRTKKRKVKKKTDAVEA